MLLILKGDVIFIQEIENPKYLRRHTLLNLIVKMLYQAIHKEKSRH